MPLKPSYLLVVGAGGIVVYSGIKGLGISSATRQIIAGQSPATATPANQITPASYGYGSSNPTGPGIPGGTSSNIGLKRGLTTPGSQQPTGATGTSKGLPGPTGPPVKAGGGTLSQAAAKALGFAMVTAAGWGSQWTSFNNIVMAESGWDTTIHYGGGHGYVPGLAYGIPQALPGNKMASAGSNWMTSSYTQIKWMIGYIRSVYGNPNNAWAYHLAHGSY